MIDGLTQCIMLIKCQVLKANTVQTKRADNKCQDKARVKALCPRNAYATAVVRYCERACVRKDVPATEEGSTLVLPEKYHVSIMHDIGI